MSVGSALARLLDITNSNVIEVSKQTGVPKTTLYSLIQRNSSRADLGDLLKVAKYFGVSLDYFGEEYADIAEVSDKECVSFNVIGEVAAGYDSLAIEEETGEITPIPRAWLRGVSPDEFFVLRVKGSSMYPDIQEGDYVLVRRRDSVDSGKIAVVGYDTDSATLKRVEYVYGEDWMELIPRNPEYSVRRVEGSDLELCRIYGEVWRVVREII